MSVNPLSPLFVDTITVLNRRSGEDSPDGLDAWAATTLSGCYWSSVVTRTASGTDVHIGASYLVRIPEHPAYRPYREWRTDMRGFTLSIGDYIIRGEIAEQPTAETVRDLVASHRSDAFEVRAVKINTGTILAHYRAEGV